MTDQTSRRPSLEHMPISFFAIVMGVAGLAIAASKAEAFYEIPASLSLALIAIALTIWLLVFGGYVSKLLRYPTAVIEELDHPIRLSFFATAPIGLLLISIALLDHLPIASEVIWWVATAVQLVLTLVILDRWFHREHFRTEHNSPAWFIPIVGNILVPVAGVEFSQVEISYFFFSIGLIFWLPLMAISLNRSFFFSAIPKRLMPTMFILLAPPAVAFISWYKLHGQLDDFGVVLFYFALFMLLLLISQFKRFLGLPFGLPWWAFTFPLAAMSIASFAFYSAIPSLHYLVLALSLTVVLLVLVGYLLVRTLISVFNGTLFLPE